jgi:hypothetical protein
VFDHGVDNALDQQSLRHRGEPGPVNDLEELVELSIVGHAFQRMAKAVEIVLHFGENLSARYVSSIRMFYGIDPIVGGNAPAFHGPLESPVRLC